MKYLAIAAAFAVTTLPATVFAGQCQDDLKQIDAALRGDDISPDQKAEVKDMRNQAAGLCKAGNEQEGLDVLTEAKAMLAIE